MIDLLKQNGPWFKANLHSHSTISDGKMTPQELKERYKSAGYSILSITDHSKYVWHQELEDPDFLPVGGVETAFTCLDPNNKPLKYKLCHINFWAKDPYTAKYIPEEPTYDVGVINRYIDKMKKGGWLCGLNHPGWSLQTTEEIHGIRGLDTFEVYNHASQFKDNNGDGQAHWAVFLNSGLKAWALAVDDNHAAKDNLDADDTLGGYIMLSMPSLSYENFAYALENGHFYASCGPEIQQYYIDEESDEIVLKCSAVCRVLIKGIHTVRCVRLDSRDDTITEARIPLARIREKEPFFRLELMDTKGRRAYSQPYWFA